MSRQVYTNTVRSRVRTTNPLVGAPRTPTVSTVPHNYRNCGSSITTREQTSCTTQHPSRNELREVRLERFQQVYDHDKELFKKKEEEKNRKKLEEKLKRYQGVGELGHKMTRNISSEKKCDGLFRARHSFQAQQDNASNIVLQETLEREKKELEKRLESLSLGDEHSNENTPSSSGCRLGGSPLNRTKGDHPLLAKLASHNRNADDSATLQSK